MANFKVKAPPAPSKGPAHISAPTDKALVPPFFASDDEAKKNSSPDGPRAGFAVMPSGRRQYKDEIPYPPATPPEKKPMKVK